MEILTNIGFDWQVALINLLNFLLIVLVLKYTLFDSISKNLSERKRVIQEGVTNAQEAESALEEATSEKEEVISQARKDAAMHVRDGQERATDIISAATGKASIDAQKILDDARAGAEKEYEGVMGAAKKDIAGLVTTISQSIFGDLSSDEIASLEKRATQKLSELDLSKK